MRNNIDNRITYFSDSSVNDIALPERFTFPFLYEPHPLTKIAAEELQQYLESLTGLDHNFGLREDQQGLVIGKMFGVLVIEDTEGRLGYLSGFSGKLADSNDHPKFVPPVFDMLVEDSFFLKEQLILNSINQEIKDIEADESYKNLKKDLEQFSEQSLKEITAFKRHLKSNKENRKKLRDRRKNVVTDQEYARFEAYLIRHSHYDAHQFSLLTEKWKKQLEEIHSAVSQFDDKVEFLKKDRKEKSAALQLQLFEQYVFLNEKNEKKSLHAIFSPTVFGKPPAGAGECATPKLCSMLS